MVLLRIYIGWSRQAYDGNDNDDYENADNDIDDILSMSWGVVSIRVKFVKLRMVSLRIYTLYRVKPSGKVHLN